MTPDRSREARALAMLRENAGLSQRSLADQAGVNKTTISAYERGQIAIRTAKLDLLLTAMDLPIRAWEVTLRHVVWLDHLAGRSDLDDPASSVEVAESFAREVERHGAILVRMLTKTGVGQEVNDGR